MADVKKQQGLAAEQALVKPQHAQPLRESPWCLASLRSVMRTERSLFVGRLLTLSRPAEWQGEGTIVGPKKQAPWPVVSCFLPGSILP